MLKGYLKGKKEGLSLAESVVIGFQNEIGFTNSPEYKILQRVYESIHEFTQELSEAEMEVNRNDDQRKSGAVQESV